MQVKNEQPMQFLLALPWIELRETLSLGFIVLADPGRLRAVPGLLRMLPRAVCKRRYLAGKVRKRWPRIRG